MDEEENTYRYVGKRNGKVIFRGFTYDLNRRIAEHRAEFPDCTIEQVGKKTTWEEAKKWEAEKLRV